MQTNFKRNNDVSEDLRVKGWMRGITFVAAILTCVWMMLPAAMAQSGGQGAISGTVTDATGALVPNATDSWHLYGHCYCERIYDVQAGKPCRRCSKQRGP